MTRPRLISYTSGLAPCGVATYQHHLAGALAADADVTTVRLPSERVLGQRLGALWAARRGYVALARRSRGFDGVILDYADTFWNGSRPGENLFPLFLRHLAKPPVMILHESTGRHDPADVAGSFPAKVLQRLTHKALAAIDTRSFNYAGHLRRGLFSRAAHLVTHAQALADLHGDDLPPGRTHVLPTPAYPLAGCAASCANGEVSGAGGDVAGASEAVIRLAVFGFPQPSKGFDRAIAALPYLPKNVHLVQLGDASRAAGYAAELAAQARALGVAERWRPAGRLTESELAAAVRGAALALAPFRHVHQSSSLGHFVSAGVPMLGQAIPGLVRLAADGAGLAFADCDDPAGFARAILATLPGTARHAELAAKNADYARRHTFAAAAGVVLRLAAGRGPA